VYEGALGTMAARSFEKVEGSNGIGVKVFEGDGCGPVMRWLCRCMDNGIRVDLGNQCEDLFSIPDIQFVVLEFGKILL